MLRSSAIYCLILPACVKTASTRLHPDTPFPSCLRNVLTPIIGPWYSPPSFSSQQTQLCSAHAWMHTCTHPLHICMLPRYRLHASRNYSSPSSVRSRCVGVCCGPGVGGVRDTGMGSASPHTAQPSSQVLYSTVQALPASRFPVFRGLRCPVPYRLYLAAQAVVAVVGGRTKDSGWPRSMATGLLRRYVTLRAKSAI
ncbi:hypothetical protein K431DRAFT_116371 [Polychaeton citri CBS 116435]|uniref:Secreted protein n=1 Tax=Polychaeton citri CBS 116435 TaxID=1314669 RepID=A0A9P4QEJ5_9PEZI|nr:hypothetical protein K431DRAFT_116371 [Polychaeton citri CBS 116435]